MRRETIDRLVEMRLAGASQKEVAALLGLTLGQVRYWSDKLIPEDVRYRLTCESNERESHKRKSR